MPAEATRLEEAPDLELIQRELERAIRLSIDDVVRQPLPHGFGLLLVRVALAEILRSAVTEAESETRTS